MNIRDLKPALVWGIFDDITRVPRPSKHEEKIVAWLIDFAKQHNLEYKSDEVGNVVIRKGATVGYEDAPTVILQSHMDMVCEKNSDVQHDFMHDPIKTRIEDGWVKACGTTLGADCGIGMAAALAVLIDPSIEHGPIEALFTVDEETGLTGAFNLGKDMVTGRYLINLDSEDDGEIFIGCAGGVDTLATFRYRREAVGGDMCFYRIAFSGLCGGHSGDDIDKGRANSNKLLARLLLLAEENCELRLSQFDGGNLRNAIPREANAVVAVPKSKASEFEALAKAFAVAVADEYRITEPNMKFAIAKCEGADVINQKSQKALLRALVGLPNGVLAMSAALEGLVETSTNLASVKFEGRNKIVVTTSQRSSVESAKLYARESVASVFALAGAKVLHSDGYPGWAPNPESQLLEVCCASHRDLFGSEAKVRAIHAGLECGLFLEKYPWLEMVSFGPTLRGVHSPDERIEIATVEKFWLLLLDVLKRVK